MAGALVAVAVGLALLTFSSDRLVVSAVRLSRAWGVSSVLIGALVVGLGTSLPELLVSAIASLDGELDVAVANVVGSNVANVTLVLGAAAVMSPIAARISVLRHEGLLMLGGVTVLSFVLIDLDFDRLEAAALVFGMLVAVYLLLRWSWADTEAESVAAGEVDQFLGGTRRASWIEGAIGLASLVLTVAGANLLLSGALSMGERWGLSAAFLGLLLGVGTSLPELATALAAVRRREADLVVGNVLGSNLFNSLAVAGTAGALGPGPVAGSLRPALGFMIVACGVAGLFSLSGRRLVRREGVALLAGFATFAFLSY